MTRTRRVSIVLGALLSSALLAGTAAAAGGRGSDGLGDPYYPTDGNGGYDVSNYHISFHYDPPTKKLDGDTVITATAQEDLSAFNLDFTTLKISSATVNGEAATTQSSGEHELTVTPKQELAKGKEFTVEIKYSGVPQAIKDPALGENGWQYGKNGAAFAAGEPHGAATWFPSNDSPLDKATYQIDGTLPKPWGMIAGGTEGATTAGPGADEQTWHWQSTNPMATYLATVSIDKWTFDRSKLADGTPVVSAFAPGTSQTAIDNEKKLPEVLDLLSQKFGKYPLEAAGGIFIGSSIGFSLETQTRPTYSNQMGDLAVIIHENAHQWWGDSVSVKQWKDICLNECFASYAPWLWDEAKSKTDLDKRYDQQVAQRKNDTSFWAQKLYDPGKGKEFTGVYSKGPLALHALRETIGDKAFLTMLKEWPAAHRNGNASWSEFEAYVQKLSGQDLSGFFKAWFHDSTIPAEKYLHPKKK